jgi:hypothetical protein
MAPFVELGESNPRGDSRVVPGQSVASLVRVGFRVSVVDRERPLLACVARPFPAPSARFPPSGSSTATARPRHGPRQRHRHRPAVRPSLPQISRSGRRRTLVGGRRRRLRLPRHDRAKASWDRHPQPVHPPSDHRSPTRRSHRQTLQRSRRDGSSPREPPHTEVRAASTSGIQTRPSTARALDSC